MIEDIRAMPRATAVWIAVLFGMIIGVVAFVLIHPLDRIGYDFQAFWCGADAIVHHADPYRNEPLHTCEAVHSPSLFRAYPNVTVPAPLPPYALVLFAPFTALPFLLARTIWWIFIIGMAFVTCEGVARFTGMHRATATFACAVALLGPTLFQGALAPLPIALVMWSALALRARRWNLAALLLSGAMIEPHMALPACVAAFLFVPALRWRLAVGALALGIVGVAAVGPAVCVEYFTRLLPLHALSEVSNLGQDSLTALLYQLRVPAQLAVHIGSAQYALLCITGIAVSARLARRDGDNAWYAVVPAAFAVVGGEFIHLSEVAMAVPLACAIAVRRPSWLSYAVLVLLAIPSESVINWSLLSFPAAAVLAWLLARRGTSPAIVITSGIALITLAMWLHGYAAAGAAAAQQGPITIPDPGPDALASVTWQRFNTFSAATLPWWPEKVLTWVPLGILIVLTLRASPSGGYRVASDSV